MKQKKLFSLILVCVLLLGLLCGCSNIDSRAARAVEEQELYDGGYSDGYSEGYSEAKAADPEEPEFAAAETADTQNRSDTDVQTPQTDTESLAEKIIYTADISMQTREFDKTTAAIEEKVKQVGGFIESSNISGETEYASDGSVYVIDRSAYYVLRIPCKQFDAFVSQVGSLGNVTSNSRYAENVTADYADVQARLNSLKVQEERLLSMLEKADDVDTLVALEERLSDVRYEIDYQQSMLIYYDRQVLYSTVYLSLDEVAQYTQTAPVTRTFSQRIADAFTSGLSGFVDALGELIIWLISALPVLLVLAAVVIIICVAVSRKRKKKQKKAAEQEKPQA